MQVQTQHDTVSDQLKRAKDEISELYQKQVSKSTQTVLHIHAVFYDTV